VRCDGGSGGGGKVRWDCMFRRGGGDGYGWKVDGLYGNMDVDVDEEEEEKEVP